MKSKDVLKILRVTRQTLTKYVKTGRIKAVMQSNGHYDYDNDSVYSLAGYPTERQCVVYARVSTQKQKEDLSRQIETIKDYANSNGYSVSRIYSDISSGLSYDRGEFMELVKNVIEHKVKVVFIKDKDRFTRISFNMWKQLFETFDCKIVVVNDEVNPTPSDEEEIFTDIISLLHCFAMRMYSSRRKKKMNLVEEDLKNEIGI